MAFGGKNEIAELPIHGDEENGRIVINVGDFIVTRTFARTNQQTKLVVTTKEGAAYPSPQAMLDGLMGKLTFDPLGFTRMDPKDQLKTLKNLVGLDFTQMDQDRKTAFDLRTLTNRDLKAAQTKTAGKMPHLDVPAEIVSVSVLMDELTAIQAFNRTIDVAAQAITTAQTSLAVAASAVSANQVRIADLESKLADEKANLTRNRDVVTAREKAVKSAVDAHAAMTPKAIAPVQAQIRDADSVNAKIRENEQLKKDEATCGRLKETADKYTTEIEDIDLNKQRMLKGAKFPLEGLGFSDSGVTLNGFPFEQCSMGEQLRASAAIGIALNPKLRVLLIRDASLLDDEGMAIMAELAAKHECQLWMERVSSKSELAVHIEGEESK